ncbi:hypothetical protein F5883DRAFT_540557 [Diaporthe sp. PMI_573]|nr:hypothetical protein F5883DRAFT_540557 [Diaporthaceae sp. PMI_573]
MGMRWSDNRKRNGAIDKMATQAVHAQCASEWQQYSTGRAGASITAGPGRSRRLSPGATRAYSTTRACPMLRAPFSCTAGPGTSASPPHLYRTGRYPTKSCPFCGNGRHTVEHLFAHCTGRDCAGRDMAQRRATLYKRTDGSTNLHVIFSEYPQEAARFAIKTFGIPQFTKASWQIKAARGKRNRPDSTAGGDKAVGPAAKKRKRHALLDLRRGNFLTASSPATNPPGGLATSQLVRSPR